MMNTFSIKQLAQMIYDRCGLNYLNNLPSLENKISRRMNSLSITNLWDYCRLLETNAKEWDAAIDVLTINETYFYREENQLIELRDNILPKLREEMRGRKIKIWSAACSTGEEPYTLAMMVLETGLFLDGEIEIIATDINKRVLQLASAGRYSKTSLSFRRIPEHLLTKYFTDLGENYEVSSAVKRMVTFKYLNLLDEEQMNCEKEYDVIFCRNVLIYFDPTTIKKVVTNFYTSLRQGGYLFLGHSENISSYNIGFKSLYSPSTFYYKKELME